MSQSLLLRAGEKHSLPALETEVLEYWDSINAFQRSVDERPDSKPYVFYDGPPFVTGSPHYGSILGSIAKDVIPRYWTMKGYRVERRWGWDCHGLPIEHMIEKDLKITGGKRGIEAFGIANFNNACRVAIAEFDATWEVIIRRIGRWVDFKNSYKTMDKTFMESVWWGFKELHDKNLAYEGKKVILYCPRCATPLSNFEIAMDNSYVEVNESATTYKYQLEGEENTYLLAWSTTPWNKLATPALAVNPTFTYVKVRQGNEYYVLAESTLSHLHDEPYEVVETFSGSELVGKHFVMHYEFFPREPGKELGVVVGGEFVTADAGTGVVTLAIYGEDDYAVMQANNIQLIEHVDDEGRLKPEVTPWAGMDILKSNPLVNEDLRQRGLIYKDEAYSHTVPTCYRCGTRLYYAPLPAWFINVQQLKSELLAQNEKINWIPSHLKYGRFGKGIESAPDWNISRSRYWGTPMPVWKDVTGKHQRVIGSLEELAKWAVNPDEVANLADIHREFIDDLEIWVDDARTIRGTRIPEVFDCWVESGSMPFAAFHYPFENKEKFDASYPAQFISEYIAQTRAWFYCLHVISVGLFGQPAFENAHTTGVILAADGSKMSKSKKNYTDPTYLLESDGADALRLYLMASPVTKAENLAFTDSDVTKIRQRVLNLWWNTFQFYLMYKPADWMPAKPQSTHVMDRWILALLEDLKARTSEAMDSYDVTTAARLLMSFIDELSTWYVRQSRERFRQEGEREGWNTFHFVLTQLALVAAPITPFLSEVTYQNLAPQQDSVHLELWPQAEPAFVDSQLLQDMQSIRPLVEEGHAQRKAAGIKVRQPLATLRVTSNRQKPTDEVLEVAALELNVKSIDWTVRPDLELPTVELETALTPELEAEGEAREIIRSVQQLRKEQGVPINGSIHLTLPEWPSEWEEHIRQKTRAVSLERGALSIQAA